MASRIIADISRSDPADLPAPNGIITGFQHLASYNWLEKGVATILVPGSPPLWSPPSVPRKLTPDSGVVYIDQNAARNPRFPLEPLFRALFVENPDFRIGDIDLVTDRNNIRKLLRFVQGSSNDTFQIQVEITGSRTALFTRMELKTTDIIQGFRGYGRNFEKAYTKKEYASIGHHRIVSYNFGGMRCIVRHETDGYVDDKALVEPIDNLSDALERLHISKWADIVVNWVPTIVQTGGKAVDVSSTLEIKTRAAGRNLDMAEVSSQLWISQTPKLAIAYHKNAGEGKLALPDDLYAKWEIEKQQDIDSITGKGGQGEVAKLKSKNDQTEATSDQQRAKQDTTALIIPDSTPFSDIIDYAVRKGFRQFFRRMPTQISDYHILCKALQSLHIDVLAGHKVRNIMDDMRRGKSDWDPEERREIKGQKDLARDSAFRLLYLFLIDECEVKDQNSAYNAALVVVSHPRIFKYKTRKMVRAAFEDQFHVSDKQRKNLDKWHVGMQEEGEDVTTEEEGFDFDFDSDFDFD